MNSPERHLLIISCSKTKSDLLKDDPSLKLPAINAYNGKMFLTLRKAMREGLGHNVDVLIISAKYGLLRSTDEISYYEERLTSKKAEKLRDDILSKLVKYIDTYAYKNDSHYKKIFIMLGKDYLKAIRGLSNLTDIPIDIIKMEKIGKAQQKLKHLLLSLSPPMVA